MRVCGFDMHDYDEESESESDHEDCVSDGIVEDILCCDSDEDRMTHAQRAEIRKRVRLGVHVRVLN